MSKKKITYDEIKKDTELFNTDFSKIVKTIWTSQRIEHLESCRNMIQLLYNKWSTKKYLFLEHNKNYLNQELKNRKELLIDKGKIDEYEIFI